MAKLSVSSVGGKLGRRVIEYARGLHMHVNLYDPYLSEEVITRLGASKVSLEELLAAADFISLHLPLTLETEHILNADTFSRIKPGCRLINCALGGLINEDDLVEALNNGTLAGAALDTFATEPPAPENPLLHMGQRHLHSHTSVPRPLMPKPMSPFKPLNKL